MKEQQLRIRKSCELARDKFSRLNNPEYKDIKSKLDFVIGSYDYDKNPVGLYEVGEEAFTILKELKKMKNHLVSKDLLNRLEKSLKDSIVHS